MTELPTEALAAPGRHLSGDSHPGAEFRDQEHKICSKSWTKLTLFRLLFCQCGLRASLDLRTGFLTQNKPKRLSCL